MVDHLSQSSVDMFSRCPRQFMYRYMNALSIPPGAALVFGSTYHHTLDTNFTQKIRTGVDLSTEQVKDVFADQWERNAPGVEWALESENRHALKDTGVALVEYYVENIARARNPIAVEQEFSVQLPGVKRPFVGRIDFLGDTGYVLEHKTASRRWAPERANTSLQVDAYYAARRAETKTNPRFFIYDVAVKSTKPSVQVIQTDRSDFQVDLFIDRVIMLEQAIEVGLFPRCDPSAWYCNQKWCGYYLNCMQGVPLEQLRAYTKLPSFSDEDYNAF